MLHSCKSISVSLGIFLDICFNLIILLKALQSKVWEIFRRRSNTGLARAMGRVKLGDIHSGGGGGGGYPHMQGSTCAFA